MPFLNWVFKSNEGCHTYRSSSRHRGLTFCYTYTATAIRTLLYNHASIIFHIGRLRQPYSTRPYLIGQGHTLCVAQIQQTICLIVAEKIRRLKSESSKTFQRKFTQGEALAWQNGRSHRVCLEFSLVTFFFPRKRK